MIKNVQQIPGKLLIKYHRIFFVPLVVFLFEKYNSVPTHSIGSLFAPYLFLPPLLVRRFLPSNFTFCFYIQINKHTYNFVLGFFFPLPTLIFFLPPPISPHYNFLFALLAHFILTKLKFSIFLYLSLSLTSTTPLCLSPSVSIDIRRHILLEFVMFLLIFFEGKVSKCTSVLTLLNFQ